MITERLITKWIRKEILTIFKLLHKNRRLCFILFAKYINGRFHSCLDYVYKHSMKLYVYKTNPTVVTFMARDILSFSGIFSIFSVAGPIKRMLYLKICQ